jgi:hypothetical protein
MKFSPTAHKSFLVGFDEFNQNYPIFDYDSHKIINTHDVTFNEHSFPKKVGSTLTTFSIDNDEEEDNKHEEPKDSNKTDPNPDKSESSKEDIPIIGPDTDVDHTVTLKVIPPKPPIDHPNNPLYRCRSTRIRNRVPRAHSTYHTLLQKVNFDDPKIEPKRFKDIQNSKFRQRWYDACVKEIGGMQSKEVYSLTSCPTNRKIIKGRWVCKVKLLPDGNISKYKARFVAKGYTQEKGTDYNQTFSPTGKPLSLCLIIALAAKNNWVIEQMDAVAAFLNSPLDKEIYLKQPEGFEDEGSEKVWRLHKSIYGLKQSARLWHMEVKKYLQQLGFCKTEADSCVFFRNRAGRAISILYLHVDEMIITGDEINLVKDKIKAKWAMEDLGIAKFAVGIEFERDLDGNYTLHQQGMIQHVLEMFDMTECRPASTPFGYNIRLIKSSDEDSAHFTQQNNQYRKAVGSLMYIAMCTRPDISFAVGVLSCFLEKPNQQHWDSFIHVLRYLKATISLRIKYQAHRGKNLSANPSWNFPQMTSDADWAGDRSTLRSTTGYVFKFMEGAISWRSCLQPTVALLSTEAEYRAITEAGQEALWLLKLMREIKIPVTTPLEMVCNNLSAIHLVQNPVHHGRVTHVVIKHHWICEHVQEGTFKLKHVYTSDMVANILTKNLGKRPFQKF